MIHKKIITLSAKHCTLKVDQMDKSYGVDDEILILESATKLRGTASIIKTMWMI